MFDPSVLYISTSTDHPTAMKIGTSQRVCDVRYEAIWHAQGRIYDREHIHQSFAGCCPISHTPSYTGINGEYWCTDIVVDTYYFDSTLRTSYIRTTCVIVLCTRIVSRIYCGTACTPAGVLVEYLVVCFPSLTFAAQVYILGTQYAPLNCCLALLYPVPGINYLILVLGWST